MKKDVRTDEEYVVRIEFIIALSEIQRNIETNDCMIMNEVVDAASV